VNGAAVDSAAVREAAGAERYLEAAYRIARDLCRDAVRHDGQCCWIGPEVRNRGARWQVCYASVGGSLYGGTAGIALFLAQAAALTADGQLAGTARAAIRHALAAPADGTGLYTGRAGVLVAAARVALLLADEELLARVRDAAAKAGAAEPEDDGCFDLMAGDAGRVIGLLCLARMLDDRAFLTAAVDAGHRLMARADRRPGGLCWRPPGRRPGRALLGLSHGTAGAALALMRLHDHAGDDRFADAAREAVRYESSFFSAAEGNWPDLRSATGQGRSLLAPYPALWCHGAPGIALSRLELARLDAVQAAAEAPEPGHAGRDLATATATTRRAVEHALRRRGNDFSLCHGLAGTADTLLSCGDASDRAVCVEAADFGIREYATPGDWPSGVTSAGPAPGLFLGTAGIGYFYLRLAGCSVPSVLNPDPEWLAGWSSPPLRRQASQDG
jgi:lantibiotic biosynthesis protein